jgi:hypothetical protein
MFGLLGSAAKVDYFSRDGGRVLWIRSMDLTFDGPFAAERLKGREFVLRSP